MNLFEAITSMSYTKEFREDSVDEKMVGMVLYAGSHAPSAGEIHEWEFIVIENEKVKKQIAEATAGGERIEKAPVVIMICADVRKMALRYGKRGELAYAVEDVGGCAAFMGAAANSLGLGFDFVRSFDDEDMKLILGLPENIRPLIAMVMGHPKGFKKDRNIKPFEDATYVNRYGQKIEMNFEPIMDRIEKRFKGKM